MARHGPSSSRVSPEAVPELRPAALRQYVEAVCAVGNRYVGTDGERAARRLVLDAFGEAGLAAVRTEALSVLAYEPEAAWCSLDGERFPATGLQLTASDDVEAEAVYLGAPDAADELDPVAAAVDGVDGKVVVLRTPVPFVFGDALVQRGAVAMVVISGNDRGEIGHFVARGYPAVGSDGAPRGPLKIPGVTISEPSGHRLLALLVSGKRSLTVRHRASYRELETANVVGEIRGADEAERVVVGAHYDSQLEGVGACDNATGLAALLELAATWSTLDVRRSVVFVAFADEEHGCAGSIAFCRRHRELLDSAVGMVNLDALAWAFPATRALHADPALLEFASESASAVEWEPELSVDASLLAGSDQNPFIDAGVPACWLWRYPPPHPHYHGAGDTPRLLDYDLVAETATASAYTLLRLAQEDVSFGRSRPARRWLLFDSLPPVHSA
jgi:Iap family predicted aminopeptidase